MKVCIGDTVLVAAPWSSFWRKKGVVTQIEPYVLVLIEGERLPMRFGEAELFAFVDPTCHLAGAE